MGLMNLNDVMVNVTVKAGDRAKILSVNSDTMSPVFRDNHLTLTRENPVLPDEAGKFPTIYLMDGRFRVQLCDRRDRVIQQFEDVSVVSTHNVGQPRIFHDVQTLLAEQNMKYGNGVDEYSVSAGDTIWSAYKNQTYIVAPEATTSADLETASGIKLNVPGYSVPLSSFGYTGAAAETSLAQDALDWLGRAPGRVLIWDISVANLEGALNLPDASEWTIQFPALTRIQQSLNNTPHFLMSVTASRFSFGFKGQVVKFLWANNQTAADVQAIGVAIKPALQLDHGMHAFFFDALWNENGYDLIGLHPDAAGLRHPFWGYRIGELYHQTRAIGRVFNLNSGIAAGAPAGIIDKVYVKATNAVGDVLRIRTQSGVRVNSIEINDAFRRAVLVENSPNTSFGMLRFENCDLSGGGELFSVSGPTTTLAIDSLDLQAVTSTGSSTIYGGVSYGGASLAVHKDLSVRDCVATAAGPLRIFRMQSDGANYGKVMLPMVINMQTDNNNVQLYAKTEGDRIGFSSSDTLGPWVMSNVSTATYSLLSTHFDGVNNYPEVICPYDGFIVGMFCFLSAPVTGGTLSFYPDINGVTIGGGAFNVTMTSGSSANYYGVHKWEPPTVNQAHAIKKGDKLRIKANANSVVGGGNATVTLRIAKML